MWITSVGSRTGGHRRRPDVIARLRTAFPRARLGNGFGLTETSSVSTFLPDEFCEQRPETVGFAAPVVEVDLLDVDTGGVGELLIRGQNIVAGYWNKPEQTAETFVDGWLHTGDMARIDDDGFVQIVDRVKDMVNRGGENVYCVEVENAIVAHPAVFEVAVWVSPTTMMGEKVGAVIVLQPGATAEGKEIAGSRATTSPTSRSLSSWRSARTPSPATRAAKCSSRYSARRPNGATRSARRGVGSLFGALVHTRDPTHRSYDGWRSSRRRILPVTVFGSSSTNSIWRGYL